MTEPAELGTDKRKAASSGGRDDDFRIEAWHEILLLTHLRDPERVDHVGGGHFELDRSVQRKHELTGAKVSLVGVLESPGELLGEHLDLHRVRAGVAVLREHDGAHDADRDHEDCRNDRPDNLETRVTVDRRAV